MVNEIDVNGTKVIGRLRKIFPEIPEQVKSLQINIAVDKPTAIVIDGGEKIELEVSADTVYFLLREIFPSIPAEAISIQLNVASDAITRLKIEVEYFPLVTPDEDNA